MSPDKALAFLGTLFDADIPAFLWGPHGVGKSTIAAGLAASRGLPFIDIRASQFDPTDVKGLPYIADGRAIWARQTIIPDSPCLVCFEELNWAAPLVQVACYQIVLDRVCGGTPLHAETRIVATGNPGKPLTPALADRFAELTVDADAKSTIAWGARTGKLAPEIQAYLAWRPDQIHTNPDGRLGKGQRGSSPRSWEKVSRLFTVTHGDVEPDLVATLVGIGPACEFTGFVKLFRNAPTPSQIFASPRTVSIDFEPSMRFAIACALARYAKVGTIEAMSTYLGRFDDPEYLAMAMHAATSRDKALCETQAFITYATTQSGVVL